MLFSVLQIGSQIKQASGQEVITSSDGLARSAFFVKAGQALVTGKYHKARPYSVEAVLLYASCKYLQKEDPDPDAWMIVGISARLAIRMGYHRDPRHLANISPFEGEMRRRTFSILGTFELLLSVQAGLPAIIHEEECDAEPPSNLFDTDFDEDCKVLPCSRPPTDPTPMLYYCYKSRLATIFRRVIRHALSFTALSYEDTMKLDCELHETHMDIPPTLRIRPLSSSFTDQAYMILHRLNLDLLYLKSLCILHRKYLTHDRSNLALDYSREVCINAALEILEYQAELHTACKPGGQLDKDKWMLSSLTWQDFLLAAMITCLDLYESHNKPATTIPTDLKAQVNKYDALRLSHDIWKSRRAVSRDARRASNVLAVMLSKVPRPDFPSTQGNARHEMSSVWQTSTNGEDVMGTTRISPVGSLCEANGFDILRQDMSVDNGAQLDFNSADSLNTIFNESKDIDWVSLDGFNLLASLINIYVGTHRSMFT